MTGKCKAICQKFANSNSITFLLDTHLDEGTESNLSKLWRGKCFFAHCQTSSNTAGIALLTQNLDNATFKTKSGRDGKYLFARFKYSNRSFLAAGIYAPAGNARTRSKFFHKIRKKLLNFMTEGDVIFLLGDFNCVECPCLDRASGKSNSDTSVRSLLKLTSEFELTDIWRERHTTQNTFSFFNSNRSSSSRIDRVYSPTAFKTNIDIICYSPFSFSDHSVLSFNFTLQKPRSKKPNSLAFMARSQSFF